MNLIAFEFGAIISFVFLIIWVISQVAGAGKNKPAARRQQQPRQRNPQGQPAEAVDDEIQQFLMETAEHRPAAPPVQVAKPMVLESAAPPRLPSAQMPSASMASSDQEMGDLDTSGFSQRSSQMGSGVRAEESQMAARRKKMDDARHKKFDHDLGQLEKTATTDRSEHVERFETVPISAAAGLVAMLAEGKSLRDAIIFSEIINRPTDRWE
jgi:hypothetical protein